MTQESRTDTPDVITTAVVSLPTAADLDSHPAADLFPLMDIGSPEFGDLVADVREHGLREPIPLYEGKILDGAIATAPAAMPASNRASREWSGDSPTAYVLSLNLHRRHLTDDQRATIALEAEARFEEEGRETQRRASVDSAVSATRAGGRFHHFRSNSNGSGERDHVAERQRRSDVRAAKEVGVSGYAVRQAERVKEADPDLYEGVKAGRIRLRTAVKEVEKREMRPIVEEQVRRDREELQQLADEVNPPDFDPVENNDQVRQRGEFTRLCRDLAGLPAPTSFIARHDGKLRSDHIEAARAAQAWLAEFFAEWEARA